MKALRFTAALVAAILTAAVLSPAARAQERIEVPWAELGQALGGHTVSTVLPDGTLLRGHVLDVAADQLRFDVNKTSNRALYPKGELSLAKNQLKVFSYTERRGHWRAIGATIGAAAGVAATLPMWAVANNEGGFDPGDLPGTITLAGVGGGAALGYGLGHAADTHEVTVIITKD